jgi:hypothetical protein
MQDDISSITLNDLEYQGAVQPLRGSSFNAGQWNSVRKTGGAGKRTSSRNYSSASDSDKDDTVRGRAYDSSSDSDRDDGLKRKGRKQRGGEKGPGKGAVSHKSGIPLAGNRTKEGSATSAIRKPENERDDAIVIHVCDEARKVNKDFQCSKRLLLAEMKYFKTYLSGTSSYDDIDISVHCDVHIFDWLMKYIKAYDVGERGPELDTKSVVSILISSDFLEMGMLVTECLRYVHDNINSIVKMPIDLNCINAKLLARLSKMFSVDQLDTVVDKRNKLLDKLWMKKLETMLEDSKKSIKACKHCSKVFAQGFLEVLECSKAQPFIDFHGNVIARHVPHLDNEWNMRAYIKGLRSKQVLTWNKVYWRIWGLTHGLQCKLSDTFYPFAESNHSLFHPQAPIFRSGENTGSYPCCGEQAFRFDTSVKKSGCKAREHVPRINGANDEMQFQIFSSREDLIALVFDGSQVSGGYDSDYRLGLSNKEADKLVESKNEPVETTSDRRRPLTSGGGRRKSNTKSRGGSGSAARAETEKKEASLLVDKASKVSSSAPLRKWRRHSSLHHDPKDQPPTPEHYKVNPQRRRMWKIDLQREEDVRRMEILMQQLSSSRREQKSSRR